MMNFKEFISSIFILALLNICSCENENREDNGDSMEQQDLTLQLPNPTENEAPEKNNKTDCTRRMNSKIHEIMAAKEGQFPFMAALMSEQNEYLCSGTLVSNGMILTTARCLDQSVHHVLLNTLRDKNDKSLKLKVIKGEKFPSYTANSDYTKNVALIYTPKHNNTVASKIKLSDVDSAEKIDEFEVLGYGLNAETGQVKELQYIGLENHEKFKVVGSIECLKTNITTCFKDTGGPAVSHNELVGIVHEGNDKCIYGITDDYSVNLNIATIVPVSHFKAWIDEKIDQNEKQHSGSMETARLRTYPEAIAQPEITRRQMPTSPSCASRNIGFLFPIVVDYLYLIS